MNPHPETPRRSRTPPCGAFVVPGGRRSAAGGRGAPPLRVRNIGGPARRQTGLRYRCTRTGETTEMHGLAVRYRPGMADISDHTAQVIAHLHADPYADHYAAAVTRSTGLTYPQVLSAFGFLVMQGWAVHRDTGSVGKPIALTSTGRAEAAKAARSGTIGVPLHVVDVEDPQLADKVRAMLGWAPRHA